MRPPQNSNTYADSGATTHVFYVRDAFVFGSLGVCLKRLIVLANRSGESSSNSGEVTILFDDCLARLNNAFYVLKLGYNHFPTGRTRNCEIVSHFRRFDLMLKLENSGTFIGRGFQCEVSGMYTLPSPRTVSVAAWAKLGDDNESEL